mgnify:FL=1
MNILITGGCGFVGTNLSLYLKSKKFNVYTLDNLSRKGSKFNYTVLKKKKIKNFRINIANYKKLKGLRKFDLIIDCCAEAAVEVSRKKIDEVFNTNLIGTFNILKKAKRDKSKIIFLSSSRVNSIKNINKIIGNNSNLKKKLHINKLIDDKFENSRPKSLYGFTKLASEMLIEEFNYAFGLKYIINRCGVISGPLQFGKQDQGFVSLWVIHHIMKKKLSYIGYGGHGNQVRDVLHIDDLCELIHKQIKIINKIYNKLYTVGGSKISYTSLKNLTKICQNITGNKISIDKKKSTSIYDIPYFITDNRKVSKAYKWRPKKNINKIVYDITTWINNNKNLIQKYF